MKTTIDANNPFTFDIDGDYKAEFDEYVLEVTESCRYLTPVLRSALIGSLIDSYVEKVGDRPGKSPTYRLADAILVDFLTNKSAYKSSNVEEGGGFQSERQKQRVYARESPLIDGRMNNDTITGYHITTYDTSDGVPVQLRRPIFKRL